MQGRTLRVVSQSPRSGLQRVVHRRSHARERYCGRQNLGLQLDALPKLDDNIG